MEALKNKIDFALFIDVQDGNPNGDPDYWINSNCS